MADVIEFKRPTTEDDDEHLSGEAKCIACSHTWVAVAPVGTVFLECPGCGTDKGLFYGACGPPEGDLLWQCQCGCQAFYITEKAIHCCQCGLDQNGMW